MKIISWNTNGLRATAKQGFFEPLFKQYKPDIVCLQETKVEPEQLPEDVRNLAGYQSYFAYSKGRKGYSGVGIYTKIKPDKVEGLGIAEFDDEGRTLIAYFDGDKKWALINSYFPNGGGGEIRLDYKLRFYDAFLKKIDLLKKKGYGIVFCGDVNTAHTEVDLARPKENEENTGFLPIEREWIDQVIAHGYADVFRTLYPNKKDVYTYWDMKTRARERNVGWRIDYFFASLDMMQKIKTFETLSDYFGSDHCPIMIEVK
jgi:exodeoxyribonuclease III